MCGEIIAKKKRARIRGNVTNGDIVRYPHWLKTYKGD